MPSFGISVLSNFLIFLTVFLIDKWSFSVDDKINIRQPNHNSWTFKFDNFSEFQNVIKDSSDGTKDML